jgi:hypothetical protein
MGVHMVTLGEWERGRKAPPEKHLAAIEIFLGGAVWPHEIHVQLGAAAESLPPAANATSLRL